MITLIFIQIEMLQTAVAGIMEKNHDKHDFSLYSIPQSSTTFNIYLKYTHLRRDRRAARGVVQRLDERQAA